MNPEYDRKVLAVCAERDALREEIAGLNAALESERLARIAAERERDALRTALDVVRQCLSCACNESGSYHGARKWLDERDIFNGDLNDLRVPLEVCRVAIKERP